MSRLFFWPATNCGNHQTKHTDDMATHRRSREISDGEEGEIQSADEVEALLIEEVRRLGNTSMGQWPSSACFVPITNGTPSGTDQIHLTHF